MASIIQVRRDTAANWTSANPILAQGEPGFEIDTGKLKFGNGSSTWNTLPYFTSGTYSYTHLQGVASSLWTINHNLGYKPGGIMVFDSGDTQWLGQVTHIDDNTLTIDFNGNTFGGKAYIS